MISSMMAKPPVQPLLILATALKQATSASAASNGSQVSRRVGLFASRFERYPRFYRERPVRHHGLANVPLCIGRRFMPDKELGFGDLAEDNLL
jgi:hypothetical protein